MNRPIAPSRAALLDVLAAYGLGGARCTPLAGGLINLSFRIEAENRAYVLQRLHPGLPPEINWNIAQVTAHLAARGCVTPRLVPALTGAGWVKRGDAVWRLLSYVPGVNHHTMPDLAHAREAGRLLAHFHRALVDCPQPLPHLRASVHDLGRHVAALRSALDEQREHRLRARVAPIAAEILDAASRLPELPALPLRLVHGDPKISNLLFTPAGAGVCLVDLDTVTMAPLAPELGDALRSWCNPGPEDAPTAQFSLPIFEAAVEGYADQARGFVVAAEAASTIDATATIYIELAARFAADALRECYFGYDKTRFASRGEHNLARAANQLQAFRSLAAQDGPARAAAARAFGIAPPD